ncbi:ComF family protein [Patescibacteria group bacterium]
MSFKVFIKKFNKLILDTLFPIQCISCKKINYWICDQCLNEVTIKNKQVCPICEKIITPDGQTCFSCKTKHSIDGLLVALDYKENPVIDKAIHYFKYRFVKDLHAPLGKIITKTILKSSSKIPDLIIPIPLHQKRLRWRGFNQSELLCKDISKNISPNLGVTISSTNLIRKKNTTSQMEIKSYQKRKLNLKNAFVVKNPSEIKNKRILLIDDITTTGSTIFECATALKKCGAKEVFGIVLARKKFKSSSSENLRIP